jgi:hypothetical protein
MMDSVWGDMGSRYQAEKVGSHDSKKLRPALFVLLPLLPRFCFRFAPSPRREGALTCKNQIP